MNARQKAKMNDKLLHYGVGHNNNPPGRGSGRYPYGSGKKDKTVFISGSSKTQERGSGYYRKNLPKPVTDKIDEYMKGGYKILVGDAPGVDRQVQNYLNKKKYQNVEVYGPGKEVRYIANNNWEQNPIDAPEFEEGSKEWLAKKDVEMTNASSEGLAIVLDEGSRATRNNVDRLQSQGKGVSIYQLNKEGDDEWLGAHSRWYGNDKKLAESRLASSKTQHIDQWGKTAKTNTLYISGVSGSGKSTVAGYLADTNNAKVINLDSYLSPMSAKDRRIVQDPEFNKFLKREVPDYKRAIKDNGTLDYDIVDRFAKATEKYSSDLYKQGTKLIVEGVQLNDQTLYEDSSFYNDKPVIFVATSKETSDKLASERDRNK